MNLVNKCSLAEKYIFFKYIFHYNCNLVITTSQISHYNFTNLLALTFATLLAMNVSLGMGIVKVLTVLLLLSIQLIGPVF